MAELDAIEGDITQLDVDAIVNAANTRLAGGGGVDGAIHRAAGAQKLQAACRKLNGCETGDAKATPGFDLPAQYIFHAVGPVWHGGDRGEPELLARCYRRCMALAREHRVKSLAFPAISCGVYGFPLERAAPIAVDTVRAGLADNPQLERVIFCCFDRKTADQYRDVLR